MYKMDWTYRYKFTSHGNDNRVISRKNRKDNSNKH